MFIETAYAMAPPGGSGGGEASFLGSPIFLMIIMIAIFYFLLIRPQQKQQKETQKMRDSLKRGDRVITNGGMYGTVTGLDDTTVTLEIAEKTKVKFLRSAVGALAPGQQSASGPAKKNGDKTEKQD